MAVKDKCKCKIVAEDQQCFPFDGSIKRVFPQLPRWQNPFSMSPIISLRVLLRTVSVLSMSTIVVVPSMFNVALQTRPVESIHCPVAEFLSPLKVKGSGADGFTLGVSIELALSRPRARARSSRCLGSASNLTPSGVSRTVRLRILISESAVPSPNRPRTLISKTFSSSAVYQYKS